jgi:plasmid stability protein
MKTTLDLPDDLMREVKVRAAREDRKLKDLIPDLLKKGLEQNTKQIIGEKMTPKEWMDRWFDLGRRIEEASPDGPSVVEYIWESRERRS